jgi:4-aminobutyrate aminotransferase
MSGTDFYYEPQVRLAETLARIVPIDGRRADVLRQLGHRDERGGDQAGAVPHAPAGVIAFFGAFHGRSLGALSLTASKAIQRRGFGPLLPGRVPRAVPDYRTGSTAARTPAPRRACRSSATRSSSTSLARRDRRRRRRADPGRGRLHRAAAAFLQGLRDLTREHGILLVADEVQSGMGRTGKMFASEHFGLEADVVNIAKGIASGLPLGVTVRAADIMAWPPGARTPARSAATPCRAPRPTRRSRCSRTRSSPTRRRSALPDGPAARAAGKHALIGDVRGKGLMIGIELVRDRTTKERAVEERNFLVQAMFYRGVLVLGAGRNALRLAPPLVLTKDQADAVLQALDASLVECAERHAPARA